MRSKKVNRAIILVTFNIYLVLIQQLLFYCIIKQYLLKIAYKQQTFFSFQKHNVFSLQFYRSDKATADSLLVYQYISSLQLRPSTPSFTWRNAQLQINNIIVASGLMDKLFMLEQDLELSYHCQLFSNSQLLSLPSHPGKLRTPSQCLCSHPHKKGCSRRCPQAGTGQSTICMSLLLPISSGNSPSTVRRRDNEAVRWGQGLVLHCLAGNLGLMGQSGQQAARSAGSLELGAGKLGWADLAESKRGRSGQQPHIPVGCKEERCEALVGCLGIDWAWEGEEAGSEGEAVWRYQGKGYCCCLTQILYQQLYLLDLLLRFAMSYDDGQFLPQKISPQHAKREFDVSVVT